MTDNTTLNVGTAGDVIRTIDKSSKKTQVVTLDLGGSGVEALTSGTVPVSGTVTATGPLTDTQLRATPVPVSGTVTATTGGLTDAQLRASAVPVSASALPLPTGAATETTLGGVLTTSDFDTKTGALTETAPATDTASSGLNGRLQRIAQRLTSLIGTDFATQTTLATRLSESDFDTKTGALTETAPATDTASSGVNGRLQRIAQRITSFIALFTATAYSDSNRLPVSPLDGAAVSGSVTSAAVLFTQDMLNYQSLSMQITSIGSGNTITFEGSEDQATWYTVFCHQQGGTTATTAVSISLRLYQRQARYFRARVSTFGSGTITVQGTLSLSPVMTFVMPVSNGAGPLTMSSGNLGNGTQRVVIATDQPALTNKLLVTPDANSAVNIAQIGGGTVTTGNGASSGAQRVTISNDSTGIISPVPMTSGGLLIGRLLSAATLNATNLKNGAGQVYTIIAHNTNAAVRYLKLYNKATSPSVGSDTPVMTLPIPGNTAGAGFVLDTGGIGIAFGTGISYGTTTDAPDTGSLSVAANELIINILYK